MRFLLHPRKTAVSSILAASAKRRGGSGTNRENHKIPPFDGYTAVSKSLYESSAASAASPSTATAATAGGSSSSSSGATTAKKAWGQQCSPTCGCVVRFEATYREGGEAGSTTTTMHRPILSASYRAKTVVTTATSAASEGASESSPPALLRPVLTRNGRPMLRACTCPSLHALASAAVEHMTDRRGGGTMRRLSSQLEFASTRSSPSFRSAALRAQGFDPREHSHCFDVVEEAYTALLRGYLPAARKQSPQSPPKPYYTTPDGIPDDPDEEEREDQERAYYSPYEYDPAVGIVSSSTRRTSPYRFWNADDYHDDDDDDVSSTSIGGGGGGVFGASFSWKPSGTNMGSKNHRTVPRPMESALRMFDDQQERERQERQERDRLATKLGGRRIPTDWVSYVDEQQSTTTTRANHYNNHSNNNHEEPQSTSSM